MTTENKKIQKYYNKDMPRRLGEDYEYARWHRSDILKAQHWMTEKSIRNKVISSTNQFSCYLELGPGPGTWTKLFYEENSDATFILVDISSVMLEQAKSKLNASNIHLIEGDFTQVDIPFKKKFDFFFSSRAVEYIQDKHIFTKRLSNLMSPGSKGAIITKTPHYLRQRIRGVEVPEIHRTQISPRELKKMLKKEGFSNFSFYPVTTSFPGLQLPWLNKLLFKLFSPFQLNFLSKFFSESYLVLFEKS